MKRSESIGDLIAALAKAQAEFGPAVKTTINSAFGSKYADLASNIDAVRPALNKHGIALLQFPEVDLERSTVIVETALHYGEQFISQSFEAPATGRQGFNVQSIGAATTYLRRYGLQALCGLASEDDDGNSVAVENKPVNKSRYPQSQPKEKPGHASQEPGMYDEPPTTDGADESMWREAFDECQTIDEWNTLIVQLMKDRVNTPGYGKPFIMAAATEAKRRGYTVNRADGKYAEGGKK